MGDECRFVAGIVIGQSDDPDGAGSAPVRGVKDDGDAFGSPGIGAQGEAQGAGVGNPGRNGNRRHRPVGKAQAVFRPSALVDGQRVGGKGQAGGAVVIGDGQHCRRMVRTYAVLVGVDGRGGYAGLPVGGIHIVVQGGDGYRAGAGGLAGGDGQSGAILPAVVIGGRRNGRRGHGYRGVGGRGGGQTGGDYADAAILDNDGRRQGKENIGRVVVLQRNGIGIGGGQGQVGYIGRAEASDGYQDGFVNIVAGVVAGGDDQGGIGVVGAAGDGESGRGRGGKADGAGCSAGAGGEAQVAGRRTVGGGAAVNVVSGRPDRAGVQGGSDDNAGGAGVLGDGGGQAGEGDRAGQPVAGQFQLGQAG